MTAVDPAAWITAARARADAATPGPWRRTFARSIEAADDTIVVDQLNDGVGAGVVEPADAEFIAAARSDLPTALAALTAVLDLHHRESCEDPSCPSGGVHCAAQCADDLDPWPCATFKAVRDALGELS